MTCTWYNAIAADSPLAGFENIFNADISRVVIDQMMDTCKEYPMECEFGLGVGLARAEIIAC